MNSDNTLMNNLTDRFIDDLYALTQSIFSDELLHQAKRCLLDYLGVTIAGADMLKNKGENLFEAFGEKEGQATLIGHNKKTSIELAAFINGVYSHVAELDDGINSGIVHPGAPVISALLPIAEQRKVAAYDLLVGVIIGYEATIRLANAIQPFHKKRGFHATGTCGTIGAAMGIAAMLHFSKSQMKAAFSAAAVSASGTLKVLEDDSELKPYNVGRAANNGILSAFMALSGFRGPLDVLSGQAGFLSAFTDQYDLSGLSNFLDKQRSINEIYIKPYAACRYCHPAIEATIKVSGQIKGDIPLITNVQVKTYELAVNKHDHTSIEGISSAKMSIPYSVAVSLVNGKATIEDFSMDYIHNPIISSLTKKVNIVSSDELTSLFPKKCSAIVEVFTKDGRSYTERVDFPKGEPENPLSDIELEEKFISLAQFSNKPKEEYLRIIKCVWNLQDNLQNLFRVL